MQDVAHRGDRHRRCRAVPDPAWLARPDRDIPLFCVASAILYHPFWKYSDFWKSGNSTARGHFLDFLKNFGLVGGLLLIVFATQLAPADFGRDFFHSTQVYTPAGTAPVTSNYAHGGSDCHEL